MYANKILKARKKIMIWIAVNHAGRAELRFIMFADKTN